MDSVNALSRAFSISTEEEYGYDLPVMVCQCPKSGFLHFYKNNERRRIKINVSMP